MAGKFGFGTVFSVTYGDPTPALTPIASLTSIKGVELTADDVDVTAHDSPNGYREFIQGLKDGGTIEVEGNYTNVESQVAMVDLFHSGEVVAMKIQFPNALGNWTFSGYVNKVATDAPMDDKLGFSASVKVSGKPVLA